MVKQKKMGKKKKKQQIIAGQLLAYLERVFYRESIIDFRRIMIRIEQVALIWILEFFIIIFVEKIKATVARK